MSDQATPAFRYTPGDGNVYTFHGGAAEIIVSRVTYAVGGIRAETPIDRIPYTAPALRTAQALMATVDEWRASAPLVAS